jgi:flagellar basal body-associated protein FliL
MQGETKLEEANAHKASGSIWIFVIISFFLFIWLMMINLQPDFYDESMSFGLDFTTWIIIYCLIMIFFFAIIMVGYFPFQAGTPAAVGAATEDSTKTQEFKAVPSENTEAQPEVLVVEAEAIEVELEEEEGVQTGSVYEGPIKPKLVEYPKKVPGGVYGDTIIRVDYDTKLNLRTLLVRSCMICDRQDKCWEEVRAFLDRDKFLENIECKSGLRRKTKPEPKRKQPPSSEDDDTVEPVEPEEFEETDELKELEELDAEIDELDSE